MWNSYNEEKAKVTQKESSPKQKKRVLTFTEHKLRSLS